jgi:hypothetical protein
MPQGESPFPELRDSYGRNAEVWATSFFACLVIAALLGLAPNPLPAVAFTVSAVILYLLSRVLAFQLYSPERYYSFGMRMAALALMVSIPARMFGGLRRRPRAILNNLVAAGLLLLVWGATGNGQKRPSGMFIDRRQDSDLYAFVRTLPKNARFASHPLDGDGIPYFGARATMGTFETLQPWFVESWRRQKERCFATLDALYSNDTGEVLRYAERYHVTHFLINKQRYRSNFAAKSGSFQPFTNYAKRAIADRKRSDLVFSSVPAGAVVYSSDRWQVVDVSRLARANR